MSSYRPERVGDRIREILARLLREELRDPRVGFVTVTDVEVTRDLREARVFVSALGEAPEESLAALERASGFLRSALAREAGLRFTPRLQFSLDRSIAGGFHIERVIDEALEDGRGDGEEPEAGTGDEADDHRA